MRAPFEQGSVIRSRLYPDIDSPLCAIRLLRVMLRSD